MNKVLDCSTYDTAKETVANIFGTDESSLSIFLKYIDEIPNDINPSVFIYLATIREFGDPGDDFQVIWFHGTRVANPSSFYEEGILPKSGVQAKIESILAPLAEGLVRKGDNPFSLSLSA